MEKQEKGISSFQKHLTWWVLGCMVVGVLTRYNVIKKKGNEFLSLQ